MKIAQIILVILTSFHAFGQTENFKCDLYKNVSIDFHTDLTFSNNRFPFNLDTLENWKTESQCELIKSICFIDFDTIPSEFQRFRNVEKIRIQGVNHQEVYRLENFPKLKELLLEEAILKITDDSYWLKNIEQLTTNKTKIVGLKSFSQLERLTHLTMSFSGFDSFPTNFNTLENLEYLSFGGHTFGNLNLSQIDFQQLKKLNYFEVVCWFDLVTGLPAGLSNAVCTKINYQGMTRENKARLKTLTR